MDEVPIKTTISTYSQLFRFQWGLFCALIQPFVRPSIASFYCTSSHSAKRPILLQEATSQQKGSEVYNESDMMMLLLVLGGCGWYSSSQLNDMERRRMKLNDRFLITTTLGPDLILFRECFLPHRHSFIHSQSPHAHTWKKYTT